jgi:hypothetical protein
MSELLKDFKSLVDYSKGKMYFRDLESILYDPKTFADVTVRETSQEKWKNTVRVEFKDTKDFLQGLGIDEDDVYFYLEINSPYSDYEFIDIYSALDRFYDGYGIYDVINKENQEKLSEISKFILPKKVNWESDGYRRDLSEKLFDNFKEETNRLVGEYVDESNYQFMRTALREMDKQLEDYLQQIGLHPLSSGTGFSTTVSNLVSLYIRENVPQSPLKVLFKKLFNKKDAPGGWNEDYYQFENPEDFDSERFNSSVSRILDEILEKIEAEESGVSIDDYVQMTERILKKFKQDSYYNLPKDPKKETRFKIEGFEYPKMKVVVYLQKGLKAKTLKLSEENFYNLLYQPTLFNLDEI